MPEPEPLPLVKHKTPCRECPFRRTAVPGWLGGTSVLEWFYKLVIGDTAFYCHMAIEQNKKHYCAGSMIHYRNQLKTPRDPDFARDVMCYRTDPMTVFQWPTEFKDHHEKWK